MHIGAQLDASGACISKIIDKLADDCDMLVDTKQSFLLLTKDGWCHAIDLML